MTTDTATPSPTDRGSSRPSWLVPVIVIVVIVVLVGGAFVVYKLTKTKSLGEAPYVVVHRTVVAIKGGQSVKSSDTSGQGQAQLSALSAKDVTDMTFNGCQPGPSGKTTRICTWSRPGGQLTMSLSNASGRWKITGAAMAAAGTPPATDATGSTTTGTPPSS